MALLGGTVWLMYFSPLLVVRQVAVTGHQQLRSEQVVAAARVPMGTPLARQDVDAIARRATTLPAVQAASVSRRWPDTITVTVTERRPLLAVRQPGGFALVDPEGVAFAESASVPNGVMLAEVNPADRRCCNRSVRSRSLCPAVWAVRSRWSPRPTPIGSA